MAFEPKLPKYYPFPVAEIKALFIYVRWLAIFLKKLLMIHEK